MVYNEQARLALENSLTSAKSELKFASEQLERALADARAITERVAKAEKLVAGLEESLSGQPGMSLPYVNVYGHAATLDLPDRTAKH